MSIHSSNQIMSSYVTFSLFSNLVDRYFGPVHFPDISMNLLPLQLLMHRYSLAAVCVCVLFAACSRLWCIWATHGPPFGHRCTVGIDQDHPMRLDAQGGIKAKRQPFVVGVVVTSCGLGRGRRDVLS